MNSFYSTKIYFEIKDKIHDSSICFFYEYNRYKPELKSQPLLLMYLDTQFYEKKLANYEFLQKSEQM